jgi:hypothetical protein
MPPPPKESFWNWDAVEEPWELWNMRPPADHTGFDYPRFALFVARHPGRGILGWLTRLYTTHPSISGRIEELERPMHAQDDSRMPLAAG